MAEISGLNADAFARLAAEPTRGPIAMLNLLKFKPDGGRERYGEYAAAAFPLVQKIGGRVLYAGDCGELVIGTETWDLMIVVEYPSAGAFVGMIQSDEYQAIAPIREAGLVRSVLYETRPASLAAPGQ